MAVAVAVVVAAVVVAAVAMAAALVVAAAVAAAADAPPLPFNALPRHMAHGSRVQYSVQLFKRQLPSRLVAFRIANISA